MLGSNLTNKLALLEDMFDKFERKCSIKCSKIKSSKIKGKKKSIYYI